MERRLERLFDLPADESVQADVHALFKMKPDEQAEYLGKAVGSGLLTVNEARDALGRPPDRRRRRGADPDVDRARPSPAGSDPPPTRRGRSCSPRSTGTAARNKSLTLTRGPITMLDNAVLDTSGAEWRVLLPHDEGYTRAKKLRAAELKRSGVASLSASRALRQCSPPASSNRWSGAAPSCSTTTPACRRTSFRSCSLRGTSPARSSATPAPPATR